MFQDLTQIFIREAVPFDTAIGANVIKTVSDDAGFCTQSSSSFNSADAFLIECNPRLDEVVTLYYTGAFTSLFTSGAMSQLVFSRVESDRPISIGLTQLTMGNVLPVDLTYIDGTKYVFSGEVAITIPRSSSKYLYLAFSSYDDLESLTVSYRVHRKELGSFQPLK